MVPDARQQARLCAKPGLSHLAEAFVYGVKHVLPNTKENPMTTPANNRLSRGKKKAAKKAATKKAATKKAATKKAAAKNNAATKTAAKKNPALVHFYVLLDRSGSMSSMKSDVIGGYNTFLAEQMEAPGRARMTLVQFDSQNHHDVILDAVPLQAVAPMTEASFNPRGGTPLLDATVTLIEKIHGRIATRAAMGKSDEEIVIITITDGEENQSRFSSLEQVRALVTGGQEAGWSFVFLGAGLDAYAEAQRLGYDTGSIQAFAADGDGAKTMWLSVSRASRQMRADLAADMAFEKKEYFRGLKEAEAQQRHGNQGSDDAN
jgi:Mg-chelatase subunit ChlD